MKTAGDLLQKEISFTKEKKKFSWEDMLFMGIVLSALAYLIIRIDVAFYNYLAG